MRWPAYPDVKAPVADWLGELPSHWGLDRFRHVFRESDERNGTNIVGDMLSVSGYRGVEIKQYDSDELKRSDEDLAKYRVVRPGQLAVNTMWLNYGGLGISKVEGHMSPDYKAYWVRPGFNPDYLNYLLRSESYVAGYTTFLTGVRPNSLRIDHDSLMSIPVVSPPLAEQDQIVDFLDHETAKIDALIAKQEQLIATLREDRTATITDAVTKGLDPDVELTQSVDEMLPPSPVHWNQRVPLKRVASVQTGLTLGKTVEPPEAISVPYLRVANVQTGAVNLDEVKTVEVHRAEVNNYLLRAGDVLMTEGGDIDKLGRGCLWSGEISPCIHQNHVFAVRCNDELDSKFLVYLLDTSVARNYFFMTAKKTTNLASTNSTTLGRFYFSLPPRREQNQTVRFLDRRSGNIDMLIAKANEVIATLREYRSALITDAVTGKIDVRGAA